MTRITRIQNRIRFMLAGWLVFAAGCRQEKPPAPVRVPPAPPPRAIVRAPIVVAKPPVQETPLAAPMDPESRHIRRILPRDQILAIDNPTFVAAEKAQLDPKDKVVGVVVGGSPRCYATSLLNHHEVVNDSAGNKDFAVVW